MEAERRAFLVGSSHAILCGSALASAAAQSVAADDPTATMLPRGGTSHFAQLNGVRLHYVSVGSGPTV